MTGISTGQLRRTIEEYFEDRDMRIACRKRRRGYNLYFADDNTPLARLRPTGEEDIVELDWWDGNHWQSVTEFGLALPLEEALDYVTDDPEDVFFEADDDEEEEEDYDREIISNEDAIRPMLFDSVVGSLVQPMVKATVGFALLGGACGGMVAGAPWGLLYGAGAAIGFCLLYTLIGGSFRVVKFSLVFSGLPAMLLAGAAGAVGAAVCQALGGGLWPSVGGAVVAAACAFLISAGAWPAWLVGFVAGLNLGMALAGSLEIRQHFLGAAVTALLATFTAFLCRKMGNIIFGAFLAASGSKANGIEVVRPSRRGWPHL